MSERPFYLLKYALLPHFFSCFWTFLGFFPSVKECKLRRKTRKLLTMCTLRYSSPVARYLRTKIFSSAKSRNFGTLKITLCKKIRQNPDTLYLGFDCRGQDAHVPRGWQQFNFLDLILAQTSISEAWDVGVSPAKIFPIRIHIMINREFGNEFLLS